MSSSQNLGHHSLTYPLSKENITLYYVNAHSLNNKLLDLQCNLYSTLCPPDVIVITETWLQPDTFDQELGLTDYNIYRCDRDL